MLNRFYVQATLTELVAGWAVYHYGRRRTRYYGTIQEAMRMAADMNRLL